MIILQLGCQHFRQSMENNYINVHCKISTQNYQHENERKITWFWALESEA